jgi:hypothetical protein
MEAYASVDREVNTRNTLATELDKQLAQLRRDETSFHAGSLVRALEQAQVENVGLTNDIQTRLSFLVERLCGLHSGFAPARFIEVGTEGFAAHLVAASASSLKRRDSLVLHAILGHAHRHPEEQKAFLTGNTNDFGRSEIRDILMQAGIDNLFPNTSAFLGWLSGQTDHSM